MKLTIELVPQSSWGNNLRSELTLKPNGISYAKPLMYKQGTNVKP